MNVRNVHERKLSVSLTQAGRLLDSLASADDCLWPHEMWPPMKFDKPLQVGSKGGHGPIRYTVTTYTPGTSVAFTFTGPTGFNGQHRFELEQDNSGNTILRHVLEMKATGAALLTWPVVFRPLHDALIEDSFDKAEKELGLTAKGSAWSPWVKFLRWVLRRVRPRDKSLKRSH